MLLLLLLRSVLCTKGSKAILPCQELDYQAYSTSTSYYHIDKDKQYVTVFCRMLVFEGTYVHYWYVYGLRVNASMAGSSSSWRARSGGAPSSAPCGSSARCWRCPSRASCRTAGGGARRSRSAPSTRPGSASPDTSPTPTSASSSLKSPNPLLDLAYFLLRTF